jgi:RNA polymerase sigma-70 factor (ECF subfamily)
MWRTDEELMLAYAHGDELAFETLYYRYEKPILNFINRILMNSVEAETCCQETFFRVIRAKKTYEVQAPFKTWIYKIALNLCRDRLRRKKHRSHLSLSGRASRQTEELVTLGDTISDAATDVEKQLEHQEMVGFIKEALLGLSQEEHLVVTMKEYQELKLSEIADILDCPLGTVKSHCHRAFKKLTKSMAKYL